MDVGSLVMLLAVVSIFYFVLVRPQKKRMLEHTKLLSSLAEGDEVVTLGGLYGFVNRIDDDTVWLEVAEDTEMRFTKQAISRRISTAEEAAETDVDDDEEEVEPETTEVDETESS